MPFRKILKLTLQTSKTETAALLTVAGLLMLVYNLHLNTVVILYPAVLAAAAVLVYLIAKGLSLARFYTLLDESETAPSDEAITGNDTQARVFSTINNVHNRHLTEIYRLSSQIESKDTLFSGLVHAMKSSVAVIALACEKLDGNTNTHPALTDIAHENEKLKKGLEQALNILRLEAFANDYVPERAALSDIVKEAVNDHKRDFIYSGIYPQLHGGALVHTDRKWCQTLLTQLISNAIKYSEEGANVVFDIAEASDGVKLRITDKGVGIPPEDLPRVFDMFFTGTNGRGRNASTGIGLFMAKHIADRLGVTLEMDSVVGRGTVATLTFRK